MNWFPWKREIDNKKLKLITKIITAIYIYTVYVVIIKYSFPIMIAEINRQSRDKRNKPYIP